MRGKTCYATSRLVVVGPQNGKAGLLVGPSDWGASTWGAPQEVLGTATEG